MTMLCVTHEMGFAKTVANRVIFMDGGEIIEENEPHEFFDNPQHERTQLFLSQILAHYHRVKRPVSNVLDEGIRYRPFLLLTCILFTGRKKNDYCFFYGVRQRTCCAGSNGPSMARSRGCPAASHLHSKFSDGL
jgi:ABC-type oligopeptide transport system ATPase subunit